MIAANKRVNGNTICDALHKRYHLYNLKNVKNIHGGVLLLVKLHATQNMKYVMKI